MNSQSGVKYFWVSFSMLLNFWVKTEEYLFLDLGFENYFCKTAWCLGDLSFDHLEGNGLLFGVSVLIIVLLLSSCTPSPNLNLPTCDCICFLLWLSLSWFLFANVEGRLLLILTIWNQLEESCSSSLFVCSRWIAKQPYVSLNGPASLYHIFLNWEYHSFLDYCRSWFPEYYSF